MFDRRKFIRVGSIVGLSGAAGCLSEGVGNDRSTATPTRQDNEETTTANSQTTEPQDTEEPTTEASTEEPEQEEVRGQRDDFESTHPEADWIVAKDGSGDYDTYEQAERISVEGEVIKLTSGEYSIDVEKPISIVGDGRNSTVVDLSLPEFTVPVWNMDIRSIEGPDDNNIEIHNSTVSANIEATSLLTRNSHHTEEIKVVKIAAENSKFDGPLNLQDNDTPQGGHYSIVEMLNCEASDEITSERFEQFQAANSIFDVRLDMYLYSNYGTLDNCLLKNGADLRIDQTDMNVTKSTIGQDSSGTSIHFVNDFEAGMKVSKCEIAGAMVLEGRTYAVDVMSNICDAGNNDYFIDGKGPDRLVGNVFKNGDIRLDSNTTVFMNEVGNYYENFDGADEDGDGIIDKPRPIPGQAELIDRYPLKDPSTYEF